MVLTAWVVLQMFYLLKNCKEREIQELYVGDFWKLCFDLQEEQQIK